MTAFWSCLAQIIPINLSVMIKQIRVQKVQGRWSWRFHVWGQEHWYSKGSSWSLCASHVSRELKTVSIRFRQGLRPFVTNPPGSDGIRFVIVLMLVLGHRPILLTLMKMQVVFSMRQFACFLWRNVVSFLSEASYSVVLDTGCSATLCGYKWLDMYLLSLLEEQRSEIKLNPSNNMLKFGAGVKVPSECVCSLGSCWWQSYNHHWCSEIRHTYAPIKASYEEGMRQDRHITLFSLMFWCYSSVEYSNKRSLILSHAINMRAIFSSVIFSLDIRFCLREANTIPCCWGDNIEHRHISDIKREHMKR